MEQREPLRKRLGRFVALMGLLFVIVAGVVVSQRLSKDTLALLVGLLCGVAAMLPTIALGVLIWRREDRRQQAAAPRASIPQQPPVIVVTPQGLPAYGYNPQALPTFNDQNGPWPLAQHPQREFKIVGDTE